MFRLIHDLELSLKKFWILSNSSNKCVVSLYWYIANLTFSVNFTSLTYASSSHIFFVTKDTNFLHFVKRIFNSSRLDSGPGISIYTVSPHSFTHLMIR